MLVELELRARQLAGFQVALLSALLRTLDLRDKMTARHSAAVARYAREIAKQAGLSEAQQCFEMAYHFGITMVFNLCLGLVSPPAGTTLFIAAGISRASIAEISRPLLPIFAAGVVALLIVAYTPALTLWLPRMLGLL